MSRRDYRHRETKKPKKETKKISVTPLPPPATVEVVRKKRKEEEAEFK